MTKHIHCDNCGNAVPYGTKVWAYGSMRYCNGKCLMASFQENQLEPVMPEQNWTVLREKYLAEERAKYA